MLQGRPKISHATTKTQCSQVNKYILVFKKGKALELLLRCPSLLAIPSSSSWAPWHPSLPRTLPGHSGCWHLSRAASSWKAFPPAMFVLGIKGSGGACNFQIHLFLSWQPALELLFLFPKPLIIPFQTRWSDSIIQRKNSPVFPLNQRTGSCWLHVKMLELNVLAIIFPSFLRCACRSMIIFSLFSVSFLRTTVTVPPHHSSGTVKIWLLHDSTFPK